MNAADLARAIADATAAEFPQGSDSEVFPSAYFNSGVFAIAPNGMRELRAPRFCATNLGASQLTAALTASRRPDLFVADMKLAPAMELRGGWTDSENVPWLVFGREIAVNAGLLLDYFDHGFPPVRALNSCQLEVIDAQVAGGLRDPLSQQERDAVMAQTA